MRLAAHKRDWEELAELDPCWAIVSAPGTQHGRWELERFFATGRADVERLMEDCRRLGRPERRELALDFGCGVGRHARFLAEEFERCLGVDVSEEMVRRARELNAGIDGLEFQAGAEERLAALPDAGFDLVHCQLVLMHLPDADAVLSHLDQLVRVLRPGGLFVFQLPTEIAPRRRLQPRRRLYRVLRAAGVPARVLYRRLGLNPIRMTAVPGEVVEKRLESAGAPLLEREPNALPDGIDSQVYRASKLP